MVPQLVVPDLTDCDLKPYVSYRTTDIYQVRTIMLQWVIPTRGYWQAVRFDWFSNLTDFYRDQGWPKAVPRASDLLLATFYCLCHLKAFITKLSWLELSWRSLFLQEPFTSQDLFNIVYGKKILSDYKEGKLDGQGQPLEPSPEESMTADEAEIKARQVSLQRFIFWNIFAHF